MMQLLESDVNTLKLVGQGMETKFVPGIEIRYAIPETKLIIGADGQYYLVSYWQGAELAVVA